MSRINRHGIDRRAFLRGAGGAALSLPLLDAMFARRAEAAGTPPKRYIIMYCGQALQSESGGTAGGPFEIFKPTQAGTLSSPLKLALSPLESLKEHLAVISGLRIPVYSGSTPVPGGRVPGGFHYTTTGPMVSGVASTQEHDDDSLGETSDVIVARQIAGNVKHKHLAFRAQAAAYKDFMVDEISWNAPVTSGGYTTTRPIVPTASPRLAYNTLFQNFAPPATRAPLTAQQLAEARAQARRYSVVDMVRASTEALVNKLGGQDRQRMSDHLDAVRTLENRLAVIDQGGTNGGGSSGLGSSSGANGGNTGTAAGGSTGTGPGPTSACLKPTSPGSDPSANAAGTYSNEDARAYAFEDMIHMAFACDLARVVSYQLTGSMSGMVLPAGTPVDQQNTPLRYTDWQGENVTVGATDLHNVTHNMSSRTLAQTIAWHMKHFAYLIQKLKDTRESSGTLLDHTVLVMLIEGGAGSGAPHTSEQMGALIATGSSTGLRTNIHVASNNAHPAQVLVSAMQAAGVNQTRLGDISGRIDALHI